MSRSTHTWPWALDAAKRRYRVGDLVCTTKHSWFGPGVVGEVSEITLGTVTLDTGFPNLSHATVRPYHVLVQERRTGTYAALRRLWKRVKERMNE